MFFKKHNLWYLFLLLPNILYASADVVGMQQFSLANFYLSQVFGMVGSSLSGANPLLSQLFYSLNTAFVAVMSVFVAFSIVLSIVNTSQDGSMIDREKKQMFWEIFRPVLGVSLIFPSLGTGYSVAQGIVMSVVVAGSTLADGLWNEVVSIVSADSYAFVASGGDNWTSDDGKADEAMYLSDAVALAQDVYDWSACYWFNWHVYKQYVDKKNKQMQKKLKKKYWWDKKKANKEYKKMEMSFPYEDDGTYYLRLVDDIANDRYQLYFIMPTTGDSLNCLQGQAKKTCSNESDACYFDGSRDPSSMMNSSEKSMRINALRELYYPINLQALKDFENTRVYLDDNKLSFYNAEGAGAEGIHCTLADCPLGQVIYDQAKIYNKKITDHIGSIKTIPAPSQTPFQMGWLGAAGGYMDLVGSLSGFASMLQFGDVRPVQVDSGQVYDAVTRSHVGDLDKVKRYLKHDKANKATYVYTSRYAAAAAADVDKCYSYNDCLSPDTCPDVLYRCQQPVAQENIGKYACVDLWIKNKIQCLNDEGSRARDKNYEDELQVYLTQYYAFKGIQADDQNASNYQNYKKQLRRQYRRSHVNAAKNAFSCMLPGLEGVDCSTAKFLDEDNSSLFKSMFADQADIEAYSSLLSADINIFLYEVVSAWQYAFLPTKLQTGALGSMSGVDYHSFGSQTVADIVKLPIQSVQILGTRMVASGINFMIHAIDDIYLELAAILYGGFETLSEIATAGAVGGLMAFAGWLLMKIAKKTPGPWSPFMLIAGTILYFTGATLAIAMQAILIKGLAVLQFITYFRTMWLPMCMTVVASIISVAGVFAYYVPLIPTMTFTITSIGWLIMVVEAMLAAPVIALGMALEGGKHHAFGRAAQLYAFFLNIFLRPACIVAGFIIAILLMFAVVSIFNQLGTTLLASYYQQIIAASFSVAANSKVTVPAIMADSNQLGVFVIILVSMIFYMYFLLSIINACFSAVYVVPNRVIRYLGGQPDRLDEAMIMRELEAEYAQLSVVIGGPASSTQKIQQSFNSLMSNWFSLPRMMADPSSTLEKARDAGDYYGDGGKK